MRFLWDGPHRKRERESTDALSTALNGPPDVLIIKDVLSEMNGGKECSMLREIPRTAEVRTICYSETNQDSEKRLVPKKQGIDAVVSNSEPDTILREVKRLLK